MESNIETGSKVEKLTSLVSNYINIIDGNFLFSIESFYEDNGVHITISKPNIPIQGVDNYYDEDVIIVYKEFINKTLSTIFKDNKERNIDKMTESIFDFEKKLADVYHASGDDSTDNMDDLSIQRYAKVLSTKHLMRKQQTINSLNRKYPFIKWNSYFEQYLKFYEADIESIDDLIIDNKAPKYFKYLNKILKETNFETLSYYTEWNLIMQYMFYGSEDIKKLFNDFDKKIIELEENETKFIRKLRQEIDKEGNYLCFHSVHSIMYDSISRYFVKDHFNDEIKERILEMVKNIKQAMLERFAQIEWLDKETREIAIEKVNIMIERVGAPEYLMNPQEIYEYYKDLETNPDNYLINIINGSSFKDKKNFNNDHFDQWKVSPEMVNACYQLSLNAITIPAGIIQPPFYSLINPDYINYSTIGHIIGHELTHGFDNKGKNYNPEGYKINWWTDSTAEKFNNLSQCYVDQYSKYYLEDSNGEKYYVDGKLTLGENIADNGGLDRSYEAWKLSINKNQELAKKANMVLKGLEDFTLEQLFYISFGQIYCYKEAEENYQYSVDDVHSPSKFRVLGTLSNSEHFAKTFNCPKNSPMNPEKKCHLW